MTPLEKNNKSFGYALTELNEYRFSLDGVELQLPMSFADLEQAGWEYQGDETEIIEVGPYGSYWSGIWKKEEFTIFTRPYNNSDSAVQIKDCLIVGIKASESESLPLFKEYSGEFILPGGIKLFESTKYDVLIAYGEPEDASSDYNEISYMTGEFSGVTFYYSESAEKITGVLYMNIPWPINFSD